MLIPSNLATHAPAEIHAQLPAFYDKAAALDAALL